MKKNKLINLTGKEFKKLFLIFLIWRIGLFTIAYLANMVLPYAPSFVNPQLLENFGFAKYIYSFANFDGVHYITIATQGYFGIGLIQAFFPIYPLLMTVFNLLLNNMLLSGLILSNLFTLIFLILFYNLLKTKYSKQISWLTLLIFLLFPSSFFLGAVYNESLFLSLVVLSLTASHHRKWWLAGISAGIASATRIVGIFLFPALLIELLGNYQNNLPKLKITIQAISNRFKKVWQKNAGSFAGISLSVVGLLAYMTYLQIKFDDALFFLHVQEEFGANRSESLIFYPQVVYRYIKILLTARPINFKYLTYVQEFISGTVGLIILILAYKVVPISYLIFALLSFILPTLTGTFSSMPRYVLVCLPIFIYLAHILQKRKLALAIYLTISAILLIINSILFIQGYWVA